MCPRSLPSCNMALFRDILDPLTRYALTNGQLQRSARPAIFASVHSHPCLSPALWTSCPARGGGADDALGSDPVSPTFSPVISRCIRRRQIFGVRGAAGQLGGDWPTQVLSSHSN